MRQGVDLQAWAARLACWTPEGTSQATRVSANIVVREGDQVKRRAGPTRGSHVRCGSRFSCPVSSRATNDAVSRPLASLSPSLRRSPVSFERGTRVFPNPSALSLLVRLVISRLIGLCEVETSVSCPIKDKCELRQCVAGPGTNTLLSSWTRCLISLRRESRSS